MGMGIAMTDHDKLEVAHLLKTAERLERVGFPITAQLLRNEAYRLEHPDEFRTEETSPTMEAAQ